MNNTTDTFEEIAKDAVSLLSAIFDDLLASDDVRDVVAAQFIGKAATELCERAMALGAE